MPKRKSTGQPVLSRKTLTEELGHRGRLARRAVGLLYGALTDGRLDGSPAAGEGVPAGPPSAGRRKALRQLADRFGLAGRSGPPNDVLFAVQTYYALLVKLLLRRILHTSLRQSNALGLGFGCDESAEADFFRELESGEFFRCHGVVNFPGDNPYDWYLAHCEGKLCDSLIQVARHVRSYPAERLGDDPAGDDDLWGAFYQALFPRTVRHGLGEYYTPGWLADHLLDQAGYRGQPDRRVLDPSCGGGIFLRKAIRRLRRSSGGRVRRGRRDRAALCRTILANVAGLDVHPLAVLSAKANYLAALGDLWGTAGEIRLPVAVRDAILDPPGGEGVDGPFDFLVGNPPWIAWDHLPSSYRQATMPLWRHYGLFSLSGAEARYGGAKKDLAMLLLYATADRYLKQGGRAAMVVTQTLLQTKGAGDGFRRFRLGPDGTPLGVVRVDDLVAVRPFAPAANWTATIVLEKGRATGYPVRYVRWLPADKKQTGPPAAEDFRRVECLAQPIDPGRLQSPWFVRPEGVELDPARLIGPSDYTAHLGANTGGANGVYWVRLLERSADGVVIENVAGRGKSALETVRAVVEPELLFPLVRWAEVGRYRAASSLWLLMVQDVDRRRGIDEATMRARFPQAHAYLERFADRLRQRAAYRKYQHGTAFYSMYNVGSYTLAPIKVVWRRMDRRIRAAVVETEAVAPLGRRPPVPQETCVLVAVDSSPEAHYLAAVLNSRVAGFLVAGHSVRGGKGFGSPGMLESLPIRRFRPDDPGHGRLAELSRRAHGAARQGQDLRPIQAEIDEAAGGLWGLSKTERESLPAV